MIVSQRFSQLPSQERHIAALLYVDIQSIVMESFANLVEFCCAFVQLRGIFAGISQLFLLLDTTDLAGAAVQHQVCNCTQHSSE